MQFAYDRLQNILCRLQTFTSSLQKLTLKQSIRVHNHLIDLEKYRKETWGTSRCTKDEIGYQLSWYDYNVSRVGLGVNKQTVRTVGNWVEIIAFSVYLTLFLACIVPHHLFSPFGSCNLFMPQDDNDDDATIIFS